MNSLCTLYEKFSCVPVANEFQQILMDSSTLVKKLDSSWWHASSNQPPIQEGHIAQAVHVVRGNTLCFWEGPSGPKTIQKGVFNLSTKMIFWRLVFKDAEFKRAIWKYSAKWEKVPGFSKTSWTCRMTQACNQCSWNTVYEVIVFYCSSSLC